MTSLRTQWGMDLIEIENKFGPDYKKQIETQLGQFVEKNHIILNNNIVTLTTEGKLFADRISSELFFSE